MKSKLVKQFFATYTAYDELSQGDINDQLEVEYNNWANDNARKVEVIEIIPSYSQSTYRSTEWRMITVLAVLTVIYREVPS